MKPRENDTPKVSQEEWTANREAVCAVRSENAEELRREIKQGFADIIGRHPDPRMQSRAMAEHLCQSGYLKRPSWHRHSPLNLDHFSTAELSAAYNRLRHGDSPETTHDGEKTQSEEELIAEILAECPF